MEHIKIDGSLYEGGGQILRNAASISAITSKKIQVVNIRAGRPKPGLQNQHLSGLLLCCDITEAEHTGLCLGSTDVEIAPKHIKHGDFSAAVQTAGSVCLMAQVALPILAFARAPSTLTITGGTNAKFAPPIDYFVDVLPVYTKEFGFEYGVDILRRGFFPQGGGKVKFHVQPKELPLRSVNLLDAGRPVRIFGSVMVAGAVNIRLAHELSSVATKTFSGQFPNLPIAIKVFKEDPSRCSGNILSFMFIVETSNGYRLSTSEICARDCAHPKAVAIEAAVNLSMLVRSGSCVDEHMQDQLILLMAMAAGRSSLRCGPITQHTRSAIYVAETILHVQFQIEEEGPTNIIRCQGKGLPMPTR